MNPIKNLEGQTFGKWTVLEIDKSNQGKDIKWLCKCECGKIKSVYGTALRSGKSKYCKEEGCGGKLYEAFGKIQNLIKWSKEYDVPYAFLTKKVNIEKISLEEALLFPRRVKAENYIGKIFNGIKILKVKDKIKNSKKLKIECECFCGKIFEGILFYIKNNITKSCGCSKYGQSKYHPKRKGYKEISINQFNRIKSGAEARKIDFNITIEYIWDLFLKQDRKCALSGIDINFYSYYNKGDGNTSLDRIDSTKGYIEGNVQWVHKIVNIMKNKLSDKEFINWCDIISRFNENK